jgi:hypothetical protein
MGLQLTEWLEGIYIDDAGDNALTAYYKARFIEGEEKENFVYIEPYYTGKKYIWRVLWKDPQFNRLHAQLHRIEYETEELDLAKQDVDNFLIRIGELAVFL